MFTLHNIISNEDLKLYRFKAIIQKISVQKSALVLPCIVWAEVEIMKWIELKFDYDFVLLRNCFKIKNNNIRERSAALADWGWQLQSS